MFEGYIMPVYLVYRRDSRYVATAYKYVQKRHCFGALECTYILVNDTWTAFPDCRLRANLGTMMELVFVFLILCLAFYLGGLP